MSEEAYLATIDIQLNYEQDDDNKTAAIRNAIDNLHDDLSDAQHDAIGFRVWQATTHGEEGNYLASLDAEFYVEVFATDEESAKQLANDSITGDLGNYLENGDARFIEFEGTGWEVVEDQNSLVPNPYTDE